MIGVYCAHHGLESIASGGTALRAWRFLIVGVGQADLPWITWDNKCRVLSRAKSDQNSERFLSWQATGISYGLVCFRNGHHCALS